MKVVTCARRPTEPWNPRWLFAPEARSWLKNAASTIESSWATLLGRLVRESPKLEAAHSNDSRRRRRTVKRSRARVARLT